MEMALALAVILVAGFFQGSFILPTTMQKGWSWENGWFTFSVLGMIVLNWILASIFIPDLLSVYGSIPTKDLTILALFGLGWGCGSVFFGIGMEKLGMSLGYPIIMGLIAILGAIIPLTIFNPSDILSTKGLFLLLGAAMVIIGILVCTKAHGMKSNDSSKSSSSKSKGALMIAIAAGVLSSFPNIGASFGGSTVEAAKEFGASEFMAGNAVWAILYTFGFIPNVAYAIYLLVKNRSYKKFTQNASKNLIWGFMMSIMWIGSFYLYGIGAARMGSWGLIIGWPMFIALSIIVGNLWGLWRGEWTGATKQAKQKLNYGMVLIIIAMLLIGFCNFF